MKGFVKRKGWCSLADHQV